jgi:TATA-box binding protein (TBP) (component of TFIID and TFIIIB)
VYDPDKIGFALLAIRTDARTNVTVLVWPSGKCVVLACKTVEEIRATQQVLAPWLANFVVTCGPAERGG